MNKQAARGAAFFGGAAAELKREGPYTFFEHAGKLSDDLICGPAARQRA
jgi:hypothetical protein